MAALEKELDGQKATLKALREALAGKDTEFEKMRHAEESAAMRHLQEVTQLKEEIEHGKQELKRSQALVEQARHGAHDAAKTAAEKASIENGKIQAELNRVKFTAEVESAELAACKRDLESTQVLPTPFRSPTCPV